METGERTKSGFGNGSKPYQRRAKEALPILVRQAKAGQPIYYSDLAAEMGMKNPRNLGLILGALGGELECLSQTWSHGRVPPIQCLVVNRKHGIPGTGIGWFFRRRGDFKKTSLREQRRVASIALSEVFAYPRWDDVLRRYEFPPIELATEATLLREARASVTRNGQGEGDLHNAMKSYVASHAELFGVPATLRGHIEYPFASGDCLDVLFKSRSELVGVEVKGPVSDDLDISRGLFQCVKYQALLEAEQRLLQRPLRCRMVLALCRALPASLLQRQLVLGVTVRHVPFLAKRSKI